MGKIAYYIFVFPLSLLPLFILYRISDLLYFLFISVVPYRKSVIEGNLKRSFPDRTDKEIRSLKRQFYRHFCDLLVEGIKNLSISKKDLRNRIVVENPELMDQLFEEKKSVLLIGGHYGNWEWLITSQNLLFRHQAYGIGKKLTSKYWDRKVNERRERYGMRVINNTNFKTVLDSHKDELKAILVLTDQCPVDPYKSYWMRFLHQQTAVYFGAEMLAHELDYAIVYFKMTKVKRGFYSIRLELLTDRPRTMEWGKITETHVRMLEEEIKLHPELWLWSHKRWKRELPDDLDRLKKEQHEKFNKRFGY